MSDTGLHTSLHSIAINLYGDAKKHAALADKGRIEIGGNSNKFRENTNQSSNGRDIINIQTSTSNGCKSLDIVVSTRK